MRSLLAVHQLQLVLVLFSVLVVWIKNEARHTTVSALNAATRAHRRQCSWGKGCISVERTRTGALFSAPVSSESTSSSKARPEATARSVAVSALTVPAKKKGGSRPNFAVQRLESDKLFIGLADQRDRSFARNLVATVERRMGQIDKILSLCADVYPPRKGKHSSLLQGCLRVGAAQLLFLDTPAFAAIKETVDVLKTRPRGQAVPDSMVKFVNAILRRIQREGIEMMITKTSPTDNIADWLVKEWEVCYGPEQAKKIASQCMKEPSIDLSVKISPRISSEESDEKLEALRAEFGEDAVILPNKSIRVGKSMGGAVSNWPHYSEGSWWVQSVSSTLPALGLYNALSKQGSDISNMHVVDMCAAPGGKTSQLLSAGFGQVTAIEANARRSRRLLENLERIQLEDSCSVVISEGQEWQNEEGGAIAGILLDVPCSATGTGSRRPDVLRRDSDLGNLLATQETLLNHCSDLLGVGGVLVFATCSLLKQESEDQVHKLISRGKEGGSKVETLPFDPGEIPGFDGAIDGNGWLRVLPGVLGGDLDSCDGFFVARLVKVD